MFSCQQPRLAVVYRSITDVYLDSPHYIQHLLMSAFLPVLLPDPWKPRGDMCLFAKGTRSFFILLSRSKGRVDLVSSQAVCGAELGNVASQESERITGSQFTVSRAWPLASGTPCEWQRWHVWWKVNIYGQSLADVDCGERESQHRDESPQWCSRLTCDVALHKVNLAVQKQRRWWSRRPRVY